MVTQTASEPMRLPGLTGTKCLPETPWPPELLGIFGLVIYNSRIVLKPVVTVHSESDGVTGGKEG